MRLTFIHNCDACAASEERLFTDNWTGLELCIECLYEVMQEVTNSPGSEGDNLVQLLVACGRMDEEEHYND